jgi:hypothetical protein
MNRSRSKSPTKKRKFTKNTYEITQFKKLIGKGLVKQCSNIVINKKTVLDDMKVNKEKIFTKVTKYLIMSGYINKGILYIFSNIEKLMLIDNLSYSDIEKNNVDIDIIVNQYPKMTKSELNIHINKG